MDWDKGKAVKLIVQKLTPEDKPLMLFLGNDVTDYDGFRTVDVNDGIPILVGEETTKPPAQYFLYSPREVYQFLSMLRETLSSQ